MDALQTILTYTEQNFSTFTQMPFNEVDSLILSWASYPHFGTAFPILCGWEGVRLGDLFQAEHFETLFHSVWNPESCRRLFTAMAASPRFRNLRVMGFCEQVDSTQEKQFSAVTFQLEDSSCYLSFRGTNATLVGWKEDFNMAFQSPIPSKVEAVRYLTDVAAHCDGNLYLGGHSKGGNLAVYAAAFSNPGLQNRILAVFSHDGPGFLPDVLESPQYTAIHEKIHKTVPQSSIVGMLLEHQEEFQIVKSNRISFWQHDPFSWEVDGDHFICIDELTPDARYLDHTLSSFVRALSPEDRERFIDTLYSVVDCNNIDTFAQLWADRKTSLPSIAHEASQLDPDTRKFLLDTIRELATLCVKNIPEIFRK